MNVAFYRGEVVLGDVRDPIVGTFQHVSVFKVFNFAGQLQKGIHAPAALPTCPKKVF